MKYYWKKIPNTLNLGWDTNMEAEAMALTVKVEVFIAYTDSTPPGLLIKTMEDWDTDEYEPIALRVKARRLDILRRVGAEAIAKADYLIAELGTKPGDEIGIFTIKKGSLRVSECDPRT